MNPKLGIVVPVYKVDLKYLDECAHSLINQTYNNIEIIFVDDCSPDNCGEQCDRYAKSDKRVKVAHHEKNKGLPSARNTGVENLSSDVEYVTFVDADDWLDLDSCEKLASRIDHWQEDGLSPDIVLFSGYRNYADKEIKSNYHYDDATWFDTYEKIEAMQIKTLERLKKDYPAGTLNLDGACWRLISVPFIKKHDLKFIDVPYREDGLYFLYSTELADKIVYIQETFYHYRSTGGSMATGYRPKADEEHRMYLEEVWKYAAKYKKTPRFYISLYYVAFLSMQICITQKFFNKNNKDSLLKKQKECNEYFNKKPYCDVFKNIRIKELSFNHRIKAIGIKYHLYNVMNWLKEIYLHIGKKTNY